MGHVVIREGMFGDFNFVLFRHVISILRIKLRIDEGYSKNNRRINIMFDCSNRNYMLKYMQE